MGLYNAVLVSVCEPCSQFDSQPIMQSMLKSGASVDVCDGSGHTPLMSALLKNKFDIAKLLLAVCFQFNNDACEGVLRLSCFVLIGKTTRP